MLQYTTTTTGMANHHSELMNNAAEVISANNNIDGAHNSNRWEYEEITLERGSTGLGFTVAGGIDNPHYKNDNSIYITRFIPNGPAALDGRLKLEDIIVRVDDIDLTDVKHSEAVTALKNSGNRVQLLIKRKKTSLINNSSSSSSSKVATAKQKSQQKEPASGNQKTPTTRLFTSTLNSQTNQFLLPRGSQSSSSLLRGSERYSTTRESLPKASKLKGATSSQSLQQVDEPDNTKGFNFLNRENVTSANYSKSTSAIDLGVAKSLTRLPRAVILQRSSKGLGFNIVGGVAGGGTFISYIVPGGAAERSNKLHCGDQILSVNGVDLRFATHEEAATALKQAGQTVKLVVKYKPEEFIKFENKINDLRERNMLSTGTLQTSQKRSLYARALFDYDSTMDSGLPSKGLSFRFGNILHITNASDDEWWQARKVLKNGLDDIVHGIIPSKKRIEKRERARLRTVKFINRNSSEPTLDNRRKKFSFSKKFPFMKSRENIGAEFGVYSSTDSQLNGRGILSSSSTTSINHSEQGSIRHDSEDLFILSYEPVLPQDINYARPVAIFGPVKDEIESLREELSCDDRFYKMEKIVPYTTRPPKEGEVDGVKYHFVSMLEMKRDLARHKFIEAGELNNNLYGTSIDSIREVAESGKYCLLNIIPKAIKRLYEANIYPITILLKPKSIESLREMYKRWSESELEAAMERVSALEQEFGTYFTATIQMDTPNQVLNDILDVISWHSGPRIWITTKSEVLSATG